ncbi:hypothetical protein NIES4103_15740 [Nostoc sp. NIES-4103]|nr:hypothetical protein NIES4103_15740 [Nostoc sp. NIES-4103]
MIRIDDQQWQKIHPSRWLVRKNSELLGGHYEKLAASHPTTTNTQEQLEE